ncbi:MAG: hypothetical protein U0987_10275 [Afipia sp.]|nr:hypothetical protein [Afipia sp.]
MTNPRLHEDIALPVSRLPLRPNGPPPASGDRLRRGPDTSARERERRVDLPMRTSSDSSASAPASQHEFYQYFGLALLVMIAISVLAAARG